MEANGMGGQGQERHLFPFRTKDKGPHPLQTQSANASRGPPGDARERIAAMPGCPQMALGSSPRPSPIHLAPLLCAGLGLNDIPSADEPVAPLSEKEVANEKC